jgi:hypothetical protein
MTGFVKINVFRVCLITAAGVFEGDCEMEIADEQGIIDDKAMLTDILKKIKTVDTIYLDNVIFYPGSVPHHKETLSMITLFSNQVIGVYLKEQI